VNIGLAVYMILNTKYKQEAIMAYYNYQSHKIYYQEIGYGTPLLMLHGNTASSFMFSEIALEYAQNYKVILIDFLGCGKSERVEKWTEDLWFDEAMQTIHFLEQKRYSNVNIIGTSGGALAGINVALERPDLVNKIIADSFEGEQANPKITNSIRQGRDFSKRDINVKKFYEMMNGTDWESVVDADTEAIVSHAKHIVKFFHRPLCELKPDVLFTGSKEDAFFSKRFYEELFTGMIQKIGHGQQHLFEHGGHPSMISNKDEFISISKDFFLK
jgi:pimeloyl-ACP methyl ester carboxylesterase